MWKALQFRLRSSVRFTTERTPCHLRSQSRRKVTCLSRSGDAQSRRNLASCSARMRLCSNRTTLAWFSSKATTTWLKIINQFQMSILPATRTCFQKKDLIASALQDNKPGCSVSTKLSTISLRTTEAITRVNRMNREVAVLIQCRKCDSSRTDIKKGTLSGSDKLTTNRNITEIRTTQKTSLAVAFCPSPWVSFSAECSTRSRTHPLTSLCTLAAHFWSRINHQGELLSTH